MSKDIWWPPKKAKGYRDKKTGHWLLGFGEERGWLQRHMKEFLWRDGNVLSVSFVVVTWSQSGLKKKKKKQVGRARVQTCLPIRKNLNGFTTSCPWEIHRWDCTGSVLPSCPSVWPRAGTQFTSALSVNSCVAVGESLSFSVLFSQLRLAPRELYTSSLVWLLASLTFPKVLSLGWRGWMRGLSNLTCLALEF